MTCTPSNPCDPQDDLRYEIDGTCTNTPATPDEGVDICIKPGGKDDGCDDDKNPITILPDAEGEANNCFNTTQDFDQEIVLCFDYDKFDWSKIDKQVIKDIILEDICCWVEECNLANTSNIKWGCGLVETDGEVSISVDGETIKCEDGKLTVTCCGDGGGTGGDFCISEGEQNLKKDDKGCLQFTQPDDPDEDWPIFGARMFGHIEPDGPKSEAKAKIDYATKGPDGKPCVEIANAGFVSDVGRGAGNQTVWMVNLKFSQPIKTENYEVFLIAGDGSYDHIMTYLKKDNPRQGFKAYMHDIENNTVIDGHSDSDANHVASFSFMVIF